MKIKVKRFEKEGRCPCDHQCELIYVQVILTSDGVEKDEVFKVSYLSPLPTLSHVSGFKKLFWCRQRDSSTKTGKTENYIN